MASSPVRPGNLTAAPESLMTPPAVARAAKMACGGVQRYPGEDLMAIAVTKTSVHYPLVN